MSDLADRVLHVRLLLETLNDPYPTPCGALVADSGPAPSRYVPCETCRGRGEVRRRGGWTLCLVCDGRGWKRRESEPEWDAYLELPLAEAAQLPRGSKARPALDVEVEERTYGWERLRQTYDRHGSYAKLRRQLDWLSLTQPHRYRLVRAVLVDHEPRRLSAWAEREMQLGVLQITLRIGRVRVPPWLIERTAAEQRRDDVASLAAAGLTPGQIGRKLGLSRRAVQRRMRADPGVRISARWRPLAGT